MYSIATQTEKVFKRLPAVLIQLLQVVLLSFASLSGLQCALLGSLLSCAKNDVMADFEIIRTGRLRGWKPGNNPTKELLTIVSSRMKNMKSEKLKAVDGPETPNLLIKTPKNTYHEESERIAQ